MNNRTPTSLTRSTPVVERLISYEEAGKLLGVTGRTVYAMVQRGDLPAVRFGRSVRIDPADLRAYIESCKTTRCNCERDGAER